MLPVLAASLPPPEGEVLLRVSGNIQYANVDGELHLDRDLLMSLSPRVIETTTPWTEGVSRFEGPLFRAVLEAAGVDGVDGGYVRVRALLNSYEVDVAVAELYEYDVILAIQRDGEPMGVRDLGPVFVLYPFDEHPHLLNEAIRHRSVWHAGYVEVP